LPNAEMVTDYDGCDPWAGIVGWCGTRVDWSWLSVGRRAGPPPSARQHTKAAVLPCGASVCGHAKPVGGHGGGAQVGSGMRRSTPCVAMPASRRAARSRAVGHGDGTTGGDCRARGRCPATRPRRARQRRPVASSAVAAHAVPVGTGAGPWTHAVLFACEKASGIAAQHRVDDVARDTTRLEGGHNGA